MAGKKNSLGANGGRRDPYRNFKFLVSFGSVVTLGKKLVRRLKASIDSAFTRRLR